MKQYQKIKLLCGLTLLSIIAISIFRAVKELSVSAYIAITIIYSVITLFVALTYIVYNRGIIGRKLTFDMLPSEWDDERKDEFIKDLARRKARSRKLLILLIPLTATFLFEIADIYLLNGIISQIFK